MTAPSNERAPIAVRPLRATKADLEAFRDCFATTSGRSRLLETLEWQYTKNPSGELYVDVAYDPAVERGAFAAIYATLPGWMRIRGERRLALQSLDTLTMPEFRGKGLFLKLARATYARASANGAKLVYGFPNGSSAHGFFQKLEWHNLDPVPFLVRPLRAQYVTERLRINTAVAGLLPNRPVYNPLGGLMGGRFLNVAEVTEADERMTRLWQRFSAGIDVTLDRDAEYLQWRIFSKPEERYRTFVIQNGNELTAMCTFTTKPKHGGQIGYVMELMCDRTLRGGLAASHLLGVAVREMARSGADSILAWALPHTWTFPLFVRHLFVPLPDRLRPIELHFGARAFDPALEDAVHRRSSWYLSYLDSDTV